MDLIQNHIIWTICRVVVHHIFCFLKWGSKWEILFGAKIGNFPTSLKESNTLQSTSLLKPLDEFTIKLISYLLYAVQLCIMYFIYFLHWGSQRGILLSLLGAGGICEPLAHLDLWFSFSQYCGFCEKQQISRFSHVMAILRYLPSRKITLTKT